MSTLATYWTVGLLVTIAEYC